MALIVDATTGTVLDASNCYIVDHGSMTEAQEYVLENGSDSDIAHVAQDVGIPLDEERLEWIRHGRTTSVSYGPSALRDEAKVLMETLDPDDIEDITVRGYLTNVLNASEAELGLLGEHILNDDAVWNGYRNNFISALHDFYGRDPF